MDAEGHRLAIGRLSISDNQVDVATGTIRLKAEFDPRAALPAMTPYYLMKCGPTALVPYFRPGDPAVADAIKGLAGKYSSVLLANHGPVVSGDTLEAAVFAIEELEETAKLYLLLRGLNPRYLTPEQVADLTKVFGLTLPEHGHEH
jgi:ribulose-5-phosphate 4-epimerase/fuculose-1-phosphate aldolase